MQFVDTLGISKREFYVKVGISRGTLESQTGITEETLAKVIAAYPNISPSWLIKGTGEMLLLESGTTLNVDLNNVCRDCQDKQKIINALELANNALQLVVAMYKSKYGDPNIEAAGSNPDKRQTA